MTVWQDVAALCDVLRAAVSEFDGFGIQRQADRTVLILGAVDVDRLIGRVLDGERGVGQRRIALRRGFLKLGIVLDDADTTSINLVFELGFDFNRFRVLLDLHLLLPIGRNLVTLAGGLLVELIGAIRQVLGARGGLAVFDRQLTVLDLGSAGIPDAFDLHGLLGPVDDADLCAIDARIALRGRFLRVLVHLLNRDAASDHRIIDIVGRLDDLALFGNRNVVAPSRVQKITGGRLGLAALIDAEWQVARACGGMAVLIGANGHHIRTVVVPLALDIDTAAGDVFDGDFGALKRGVALRYALIAVVVDLVDGEAAVDVILGEDPGVNRMEALGR